MKFGSYQDEVLPTYPGRYYSQIGLRVKEIDSLEETETAMDDFALQWTKY